MTWFEQHLQVRGYEVDASRTVPMPVMLSYLEHTRWEWIADPAWGLARGVHDGHFFVVREQVVEQLERSVIGDAITIQGATEKVGRSLVQVRHQLLREGRLVARARVHGCWLGPNRRLARLPDEARTMGRAMAEALQTIPEPPIHEHGDAVLPSDDPMSFLRPPRTTHAPRGLDLPFPDAIPDGAEVLDRTVRHSDCDVFGHVNASTYLRFFEDLRRIDGEGRSLRRVAIRYDGEALPGDRVHTRLWSEAPDRWGAALTRGDTVLCRATLEAG